MPDRVFIDSNLWIYSFVEAEEEQERRRTVIALLEELSQQSEIVVSIQVVNETHWTLQRRYHLDERQIQERIEGMIAIAETFPVTLVDYHEARNVREQYLLSFWDSLVVVVALRARCKVL
jgi:predicted nucleic acid-binding protein